MALRKIRLEEDEILRKTSKKVKDVNERIKVLLDDMVETMYHNKGVGLAAPQVGVLKRVIIVQMSEEDPLYELINPEIIEARGSQIRTEGCLSVPGLSGDVERPEYVRVLALNRDGKQVLVEGEGMLAVCLCHEIDHLDGILYVDKVIDPELLEEVEEEIDEIFEENRIRNGINVRVERGSDENENFIYGNTSVAAVSLSRLLEQHEVVAVVTQPDKKKGRGNKVQFPPVKELALSKGIEVLQPLKIKDPAFVEILKNYDADLFVVAAYGQILSQEILDMPRLGCICVHASLLPQYRGAAPIQWAILDGCTETGVTIMEMERGIDTGDMYSKVVMPIEKTDTFETLQNKLADAGGQLLMDTIPFIESGKIVPQKQNDDESTYAKMISKEMGHLSFEQTTEQLLNWIRGLNPWPSAYVYYGEEILKNMGC